MDTAVVYQYHWTSTCNWRGCLNSAVAHPLALRFSNIFGSCVLFSLPSYGQNSLHTCRCGVLLKRGNGKRKTEDYSAETGRGNALIFRRIDFPFPPNSTHIFILFLKYALIFRRIDFPFPPNSTHIFILFLNEIWQF